MSIVAVKKYKDKIVIGADSQRTSGSLKEKSTKLYKVNDEFAFGHSGDAENNVLMSCFVQINMINSTNTIIDIYDFIVRFRDFKKTKSGIWDMDSDFIFVNKGKVFKYFYNVVTEENDYAAIGSGRDFAITAFYFGKDVPEAIKVACDLTHYCMEPIVTYEFKIS